VNQKSCTGDTPLHKNCVNGEEHVVRGLLENGGDPNAVNNNDESVTDKCCLTCYYNDNCMKKCKLVQGVTPRDDICQDNPVTALVLGDIYDASELKTSNKKCCSNCHGKSCALSCEIIENGYKSTNLCNLPFNTLIGLDDYAKSGIYTLISNNINCTRSCDNYICMRNGFLIDVWFRKYLSNDKNNEEYENSLLTNLG